MRFGDCRDKACLVSTTAKHCLFYTYEIKCRGGIDVAYNVYTTTKNHQKTCFVILIFVAAKQILILPPEFF